MSKELAALLTLNALPTIGPITIRRLLDHFGSPTETLRCAEKHPQSLPSIGSEKIQILAQYRNHFDASKELARCEDNQITILTPESPAWPKGLSHSADSPVLLYVKGEILPQDQSAIAIVGSRRTTHYGRSITQRFSQELCRSGYTIISGLARGIDTEAHQAVVNTGGRTIAVLGSGLLRLYPLDNKGLAEEITQGHGAVVSEFPLTQSPDRQTFPQRNRIVAQWAQATVVTECPSRSGSLITASFAADAGKTVFAIPGPIDRASSAGCNELIRDGAILAQSTEDIISELKTTQLELLPQSSEAKSSPPPTPELTENEAFLLQLLQEHPRTIDEITHSTELPVNLVATTLLALELKHAARQMAGQRYEALL